MYKLYLKSILLLIVSVFLVPIPEAASASDEIVSDYETYTLEECPVSGQAIGSMGDPVVETINGREVRFCCAGCIKTFRDDLEKYEAKVDAMVVEQQGHKYPLDRCIVMDTKLGGMGEPVNHVYKNRLVRFCCAGCKGMFSADPEKYLAKLDAAILEKAGEDEIPQDCAVTGEPLGEKPIKFVIANQVLFLHSEDCVKEVRKNPSKYVDE